MMLESPRHGHDSPFDFNHVTGPSLSLRTILNTEPAALGPEGRTQWFEQVDSRILNIGRDIVVHLPPGYHENPQMRCPVIYMQDGQNLFDALRDVVGGRAKWGVDTTVDDLVRRREIPPVIIVGVFFSKHRSTEYLPELNCEAYGRFLCEELKPTIDQRFRTLPGREHTGIAGSSHGGRAALGVGAKFNHIFGLIDGQSSSLGEDDGAATTNLVKLFDNSGYFPSRIWIDTTAGERSAQYIGALEQALLDRGWRDRDDLEAWILKSGGHNEGTWGENFAHVLRFFFRAPVRQSRAIAA